MFQSQSDHHKSLESTVPTGCQDPHNVSRPVSQAERLVTKSPATRVVTRAHGRELWCMGGGAYLGVELQGVCVGGGGGPYMGA